MLTPRVIKQVRVPRLEGDTLDTFGTASTKQSTSFHSEVLDSLGVARNKKALELKDNFRL